MSNRIQQQPARARIQEFLGLIQNAEQREVELEALYTDGNASEAQLAELERVRQHIEDYYLALDDMGYFNPS